MRGGQGEMEKLRSGEPTQGDLSLTAHPLHPFPARMAPEIAEGAIGNIASPSAVALDPMCGSGTTLQVASRLGLSSIGVDSDPLAVLMSSVATSNVSAEEIRRTAMRVSLAAEWSKPCESPWKDEETDAFARYWFAPKQRDGLARLAREIDQVEDEAIRRALWLAFSRIIVTKTPQASLASDTSRSRPRRVSEDSNFDVFSGFFRSADRVIRWLSARGEVRPAKVMQGDARKLQLESSSVDLVVTSPPYLNAIDYMRGHRLSLIWMGYRLSELRSVRGAAIGSERGSYKSAPEAVEEMWLAVKSAATAPDLLPAGMIFRYGTDLLNSALELARVCKPGASAVVVVGNSTLKSNLIPNDLITQIAYEESGFQLVDLEVRKLPERRRSLPMLGDRVEKRMREESVMTFRRMDSGR